ncbi:MAG: cobyric acid synthase CobQ, partial [Syntrophomonadaceae bacterium]|nr:cobyric acid synthase CobQ [Syntrophomonadaceae bacterium]
GYQMLGSILLDPDKNESEYDSEQGIGLLSCITRFSSKKTTHQVEAQIVGETGFWRAIKGQKVTGYEIHTGYSEIGGADSHLLQIIRRSGKPVKVFDGTVNQTGNVFGTYMHGVFDNPNVMLTLMNTIRREKKLKELDYNDLPVVKKQNKYDLLADRVRRSLNMDLIYEIINS